MCIELACLLARYLRPAYKQYLQQFSSCRQQFGEPPAVPFLAVPILAVALHLRRFQIQFLEFLRVSRPFQWSETRSPCLPRCTMPQDQRQILERCASRTEATWTSVDEIGALKKSSGHYKVRKCVFLTLYGVQKCLIDTIQYLKVSYSHYSV